MGQTICDVRMGKPLRWPLSCEPSSLVGRRVMAVRRRAKYLLVELDEGLLLIHLGMSGSLQFHQGLIEAGPHDHFDLVLSSGILRLHDPRRFGAVVWIRSLQDPQADKLLGAWGVEPLSDAFTVHTLWRGLRATRMPVKQLLLGGRVVVGVGNIYACETLFRAGIRPTSRSDRIGMARVIRLHAAIREVLLQALAAGGSSLRDFASVDGTLGHFQTQTMVYGRAGAPCRVCGAAIKVVQQAQRSTYFCATCQR